MKATAPVTLPTGQVVPPNPYGIPFVDFQKLIQGQVVFVEDGGFLLRHAIVNYLKRVEGIDVYDFGRPTVARL